MRSVTAWIIEAGRGRKAKLTGSDPRRQQLISAVVVAVVDLMMTRFFGSVVLTSTLTAMKYSGGDDTVHSSDWPSFIFQASSRGSGPE